MIRVSVFGLGRVGCVTGACLARAGHEVVAVDVDPEKVGTINAGASPVAEPGLGELVAAAARDRRLRATTSAEEAVERSEVALVCVGTPSRPDGRIDTDEIVRVALLIGRALRRRVEPFTVVLRSTVLPGTTEGVLVPYLLAGAGPHCTCHLRVAVNPEFMCEGSSVEDFARPPITLVGSEDPGVGAVLRELYGGVEAPFVLARTRTAEMVKYAARAFHALEACFANEIGHVSAAFGADPREVVRIVLLDRKPGLSEASLTSGYAFGGPCLPMDLRALLQAARSAEVTALLLGAILPSKEALLRRGAEAVLATGKRRVGVVGLSYREGTDELGESPLVDLVETLVRRGRDVRVLDRDVAPARLTGASRRYVEEHVPLIASLMCPGVEELLAHAEVLVVGKAGEDAAAALAGVRARHVVVDLTRGGARRHASRAAA